MHLTQRHARWYCALAGACDGLTGLMLLAFLSLASGLILDTVTRGRRELRRLHYLQIPLMPSRRAAGRP